MKWNCDLCIKERKFKVGDIVYWHRNVGEKVESIWMGPGMIVEIKSNSVYVVKSCREHKVIHHDKLKLCESGELPKWMVDNQWCGGPRRKPTFIR